MYSLVSSFIKWYNYPFIIGRYIFVELFEIFIYLDVGTKNKSNKNKFVIGSSHLKKKVTNNFFLFWNEGTTTIAGTEEYSFQ